MREHKPIRVVIVDDHELVRSGLAVFFETREDLELVGEAENGSHAIEVCDRLRPDVVLMDVVMPVMDGIEATRIIRQRFPEVQVVALTSFENDETVPSMFKAGAVGYLLKNVSIDSLAAAIKKAAVGESALAPEVAQTLVHSMKRRPPAQYDLTDLEHDVLKLIVRGMNNGEIGESLVISTYTVKNHVNNILSKLNVGNRSEAVAMAVREGLVESF